MVAVLFRKCLAARQAADNIIQQFDVQVSLDSQLIVLFELRGPYDTEHEVNTYLPPIPSKKSSAALLAETEVFGEKKKPRNPKISGLFGANSDNDKL